MSWQVTYRQAKPQLTVRRAHIRPLIGVKNGDNNRMGNVGIRIVLPVARLSRASSAIDGHDANTETRSTETASGAVRASEVSFAGGVDETVHGGIGGAIQCRSAAQSVPPYPVFFALGQWEHPMA